MGLWVRGYRLEAIGMGLWARGYRLGAIRQAQLVFDEGSGESWSSVRGVIVSTVVARTSAALNNAHHGMEHAAWICV